MASDNKGKHFSPATEFKKGNPGYWLGKKRPDISLRLKGKKGHVAWNKGIVWDRMTGENNPKWNGGKSLSYGYRVVLVNKKEPRYHFEHRVLMENILGRKLLNTEVLHHVDGDKLNNNLDNLQLMSRSEHSKFHSNLRRPYYA